MATQENTWNVANRMHSNKDSDNPALNHIITGADEVYDDNKEATQQTINAAQDAKNTSLDQDIASDRSRLTTLETGLSTETTQRESADSQLRSELNAKQLEVGAVPTDAEPTPNSANILTSGALASCYGHYVENPEFVYVATDAADRILWAIRTDGTIHYGAGVPPQVIEYVEGKIAELSLDEYEDIVSFLGSLITGDKTLATLLGEKANAAETTAALATKVDKEEGKSLIPTQYIQEVENPEFVAVYTDSEDKILFAIRTDADFYFGYGVPSQIVEYVTSLLSLYTDTETLTTLLSGKVDKAEGKSLIDADYASGVSHVENPEFVDVKTDSEDKVLEGIRVDGTKVIGGDLEVGGTINGKDLDEELDAKVDKVEGKQLSTNDYNNDEKAVVNTTELIDDPEGRLEIKTDSEDKIISYRDEDGVLHENVGIETPVVNTNSLNLTQAGLTAFEQALKDDGFNPGGPGDFSEKEVVELPEPVHYGLLNLVIDKLPTQSNVIKSGYGEYYDFAGNYWKKQIELEIQGQTSLWFARTGGKGNYTLDIVDGSEIKFGSWVPQDSFHLKGCAKDVTRGYLATSYKLAYKVMEYLDAKPNRVLMDEDSITTRNATGERFTDWPDDARCLPDGFPIEIYINGDYWGLYALQLKKHRKNYSMDKKDYTSFFLDNGFRYFWIGQIAWNSTEIKNPKDLICIDGTAYDDDHPKELISLRDCIFDSTNWSYTSGYSATEPTTGLWDSQTEYAVNEECWCYEESLECWRKFKAKLANLNKPPLTFTDNALYDATNKKHKGTAQTKSIIQSFTKKYLEVRTLVDANTVESLGEAKLKFEEYFDYNACVLVYIFNCFMNNEDSINKNTLWGTYNNGKIFPLLWDLDGVYGEGWTGNKASAPSARSWDNTYANADWPLSFIWKLYKNELKQAYANLRRDGILSVNTWRSIIYDEWVKRIGIGAYDRDIKKWPETPSYRENYTNTEYWKEEWFVEGTGSYSIWNASNSYNVGDYALIKAHSQGNFYMLYKAVEASDSQNPQCPVTQFYNNFPQIGGYYNSPKRMEKWIESQIQLCDTKLGYTE